MRNLCQGKAAAHLQRARQVSQFRDFQSHTLIQRQSRPPYLTHTHISLWGVPSVYREFFKIVFRLSIFFWFLWLRKASSRVWLEAGGRCDMRYVSKLAKSFAVSIHLAFAANSIWHSMWQDVSHFHSRSLIPRGNISNSKNIFTINQSSNSRNRVCLMKNKVNLISYPWRLRF